jgi:hypothetical protein
MNPNKVFLTATAVCSFLGALTTVLLMLLPNPEAANFEARANLYQNGIYMGKLWILFIHPQVNFLAAIGVASLLLKKYPLQLVFGTFFLLLWAYSEMSQQALLIDAMNQIWRPGFLDADNEVSRNMFTTLINAAGGISDSQYFLVIYGFGLGTLLYGLALVQENGMGKWIGISMLFIGILSLSSFIRYYAGVTGLDGIVDWTYAWVYPYLQPLVRVAIGVWILKEIKDRAAIAE